MKKCLKCNDFSLYDDEVLNCPVCGQVLSTYNRSVQTNQSMSGNTASENATSNNAVSNNVSGSNVRIVPIDTAANSGVKRTSSPAFETKRGFSTTIYRGRVTEITPNTRLHSPFKKLVNALFFGEPYQLSNTSHSTVFRVMDFSNGRFSRRKRDLIYYGDVEGRFFVGDDVTVTAKRRGSREIVTRMQLNDTEIEVRPASLQIPAGVIRLLTIAVLIPIVQFIYGIYIVMVSGGFHQIADELISLFFCVMLIVWILKAFIKK